MRSVRTVVIILTALVGFAGCYRGSGTDMHLQPGTRLPSAAPASQSTNEFGLGPQRYSFAANYAEGAINSEAPAGTPNHRGAFVTQPVVEGFPASALTVLAAYRYSYKVNVPSGTFLAFAAGRPLNIGNESTGFVDIAADGKVRRVFSAELPPSGADGIRWRKYAGSLQPYAGKTITVTFGADAVKGNAMGAWVSFADAGLYASSAKPSRR